MTMALLEARKAYADGEIPVGAIVVCGGKVIGSGHNMTEALTDVTAHAEMLAITSASNTLGGKYLKDCTLYVTVEPCVMCAGAIGWSQLSRIVIGCTDENADTQATLLALRFIRKLRSLPACVRMNVAR